MNLNNNLRKISSNREIPMICVPITGKNRGEIKEQLYSVLEKDPDIIEWRVDFLSELHLVKELIKEFDILIEKRVPLIFTFRTKIEGGEQEIPVEKYMELNRLATIFNQVTYIDLELFTPEKYIGSFIELAHELGKQVILSNHDFYKTPDNEELQRRFDLMNYYKGDIFKIAVMPQTKQDVFRIMEMTKQAKNKYPQKPFITMSMAGMGRVSRVVGEFFGSALTFATVTTASAPGQIPIEELKDLMNRFHAFIGKKIENNIFLIGFMGTGKSTISSCLRLLLDAKEVDVDEEIVLEENMAIAEIFEQKGEEYFRKIEHNKILQIASEKNQIISCGGGAVLREDNVIEMKKNGKILLLTASPEAIYERVKDSNKRPILNGNMNVEYISALMEKREAFYTKAADIAVSTEDKNFEEICLEILKKITV